MKMSIQQIGEFVNAGNVLETFSPRLSTHSAFMEDLEAFKKMTPDQSLRYCQAMSTVIRTAKMFKDITVEIVPRD